MAAAYNPYFNWEDMVASSCRWYYALPYTVQLHMTKGKESSGCFDNSGFRTMMTTSHELKRPEQTCTQKKALAKSLLLLLSAPIATTIMIITADEGDRPAMLRPYRFTQQW